MLHHRVDQLRIGKIGIEAQFGKGVPFSRSSAG
jgi:hypothetical protein